MRLKRKEQTQPPPDNVAAETPVRLCDDSWLVPGSLLLATALYAIFGLALMPRDVAAAPLAEQFIPALRVDLRPEPQERFLYLFGLACIPVLPIACYVALRWCARRWGGTRSWPSRSPLVRFRDALLAVGVLGWLGVIVYRSDVPHYPQDPENGVPRLLWFLGGGIILAPFGALALRRQWAWRGWIGYAIVALGLLFLADLLIVNDERLLAFPDLCHHFDLVIGAINQVAHGRTILVDTTSQYGVLYPYVAAWCLAPFPLAVQTVTILFAALSYVTVLCLYLAIARKSGGNTLATVLIFIGALCPAYPFFGAALFDYGPPIAYYQYYPLRVICGAFFLWYTATYFARKTWWRYLLGCAAAGFSVLWNADTGLVILVAWTGANLFDAAATHLPHLWRTGRMALLHMAAMCLTLAGAWGAYGLFAWLRSGHWPDLAAFSQYQRIFYQSGYFMLPMNPWEFWQPVILIYVVVIFRIMRQLLARTADATTRWYCFIALYGLGIFSYYQGRSHIWCLPPVVYPAAMLAGFLALDMARSERFAAGWRSLLAERNRYEALTLLACILLPAASVIGVCRALPAGALFVLQLEERPQVVERLDPVVQDLRDRVGNSPTVILSPIGNYLHLRSGSWSSLPFSSSTEIMLLDQLRQVQAVLDSGRERYILVHHSNEAYLKLLRFTQYHYLWDYGPFEMLERGPRPAKKPAAGTPPPRQRSARPLRKSPQNQ
jgi:hypothetical protein